MRLVVVVTCVMVMAAPGLAATLGPAAPAPTKVAPPSAGPALPEPPGVKLPSMRQSALKMTSFRAAVGIAQTAILTAASGSLGVGSVMAMFDSTKSAVLFAVNDYAWDVFAPPQRPSKADTEFDVAGSFWRTTAEFVTFTPADYALRFVGFYLFTGSATTAMTWNSLSAIAITGAFFGNNLLWDLYDWTVERDAECVTTTSAR